jgi:hypothetical protein
MNFGESNAAPMKTRYHACKGILRMSETEFRIVKSSKGFKFLQGKGSLCIAKGVDHLFFK